MPCGADHGSSIQRRGCVERRIRPPGAGNRLCDHRAGCWKQRLYRATSRLSPTASRPDSASLLRSHLRRSDDWFSRRPGWRTGALRYSTGSHDDGQNNWRRPARRSLWRTRRHNESRRSGRSYLSGGYVIMKSASRDGRPGNIETASKGKSVSTARGTRRTARARLAGSRNWSRHAGASESSWLDVHVVLYGPRGYRFRIGENVEHPAV